MSFFRTIALATALLAPLSAAQAASIAVDITTPATIGGVSGRGFVVGYSFEALQDLSVTALGHYDADRNGLASPAFVGLYGSDGALLASATITSEDALQGFFRFEDIAPVALMAGTRYVMGGYSEDPRAFVNANYGGLRFTVDPAITLIRNRDLPFATGLAFPSREPSNTHAGSFGPNFLFVLAPVAVPAPAGMLLLGLGIAGLAVSRRRR